MSANLSPHPLATLIPPMTDAEAEALRNDIMLHGQHEPIVLYEGQVLDGRHRLAACLALNIEPKTKTFAGPEADARALVLSLNVHRRHLTQEQKRALIEAELKRDPTQSDRAIAKTAKVSDKTVAATRKANAESPHKTERKEASGRKARGRKPSSEQPATKPKKPKAASRTPIGDVIDIPFREVPATAPRLQLGAPEMPTLPAEPEAAPLDTWAAPSKPALLAKAIFARGDAFAESTRRALTAEKAKRKEAVSAAAFALTMEFDKQRRLAKKLAAAEAAP